MKNTWKRRKRDTQRERKRERDRHRERDRESERLSYPVCICRTCRGELEGTDTDNKDGQGSKEEGAPGG